MKFVFFFGTVVVVLRDRLENWFRAPTTKTKFLSFNRTQSSVIIGLLTGQNTLRRSSLNGAEPIVSYVGGLEQRKKPQPTFYVSVKLSGFTHAQISEILFLVPRGYEESKCGGHLQLWHRNRAVLTWYQIMGHTGPLIKAQVHRDRKGSNPTINTNLKLNFTFWGSCIMIYSYNRTNEMY